MIRNALLVGMVFLATACSSQRALPEQPAAGQRPLATTQHATDLPDSARALDDIEPRPVLPKSAPMVINPNPPVQALRSYAHARIALLDGNRAEAINDLEQAVALDHDRFTLHFALGT